VEEGEGVEVAWGGERGECGILGGGSRVGDGGGEGEEFFAERCLEGWVLGEFVEEVG